jgi:glycosyltransferase involved in cell wall biosynthesis
MVPRHKHISLQYICTRIAHHTEHSGYDQITKYIPGRQVNPNILYRILNFLPERVLAQLRRTAGTWYNSHALCQELQNIPEFFFKKNQIYHFLYGEDSFHYSAYLNPRRSNKLVATYHCPPEKFYKINVGTRHLKQLDAIILVAPNQETIFKNIVPPERVHIIPLGIDTSYFTPADPEIRHPRHCLFVGTHLRDFNGLCEVISCMNRLDPCISFSIVTSAEHFPLFKHLRNVSLLTAIPEAELLRLYQTSTLLLLPMLDCTANIAVLEAMGCGLPVITSAVGGIGLYLPAEAGLLIPLGDTAQMALKALELINDPLRRSAMSSACRQTAESFDWSVVAEKMRRVYHSISA